MVGPRAREAPRAAAALYVACAKMDLNRHVRAALQAAGEGACHDGLEAPRPARRTLAPLPAKPLVVDVCAHILSAGPDLNAARESTDGQPAQLFYYLKEVREQCDFVQIFSGALLLPRAFAIACVLLSVCCCARHRTVLVVSFDSDHSPGGYGHLLFELLTEMCGSCASGPAVRIAGVSRARAACGADA